MAAGVETPALDARILMRQGGDFSDADLISSAQSPLSPQVIEKLEEFLRRRLEGEPVSRILGEREFWGLSFKVAPATLDPRADTETLVSAALKWARDRGSATTMPLRILDLGTGTGCILISVLSELRDAVGVGIDLNPDALGVARENAGRHGVQNRVEFLNGSWFEPLNEGDQFDLILSNPPYIPESDRESLARDVRDYDPDMALFGGNDGLDAYKTILKDMKKHLVCGGCALFEIGRGQEKDLARLVEESKMAHTESYEDLAGIVRVLEITVGKS